MFQPAAASIWLFWMKLNITAPAGGAQFEQIVLRWTHITAATVWLGFLYFLVLAATPMLKSLDPGTRAKVFPELRHAAWWLRWSALVSWLAGFRYFMILAKTDAVAAGRDGAWGLWLVIWLVVWLAAFAIEMVLVRAGSGPLGKPLVVIPLVLFVMTATAWLVVSLLAQPGVSNRTLCIAIGGGLGTVLFFNVWGIVWRCQKRLFSWTRALAEHGTPMPVEAAELQRIGGLTMLINFWLSFPMLFFMAASAHFPFLLGE